MRARAVRGGLVAAAVVAVLLLRLPHDGRGTSSVDVCRHPRLTTSADRTWYDGGFVVDQDMWNNQGGQQTLRACSYRSWVVTATQADSPGVKTYPNVHRDFAEPRLSSFTEISSRFATRGPGTGTYEFAYDVWLNGVAGPGSSEVMVWTDNHGNRPNGGRQNVVTSHGLRYTAYHRGSYTAFLGPDRGAGEVDLLALFRYAVARGWLPASSTLGQIDFGVEICSTAGRSLDFAVRDFGLTAR
jgi:hypothetical protein